MRIGAFSLMQWPEGKTQAQVYQEEIEQAVTAERLGYDIWWCAEHHFSRYGVMPSLHLTLAHLAARTSRIRLGTAISIVPLYHPLRLAEEIAMLDVLSDGRIEWGVGRGYQGHEFRAFETDMAETKPRLQETLELVAGAWADEPLHHDGRFWHVDGADILPKPIQRPGPPIYIAAITPPSVAWAGEHGYPFMADQFQVFDRLREAHGEWRDAAARGGHPTAGLRTPLLRHVFVGDTTEEARRVAGPALLWYYRALAAAGSPGGTRVGGDRGTMPSSYENYANLFEIIDLCEADPDQFLELVLAQSAIVGDADHVAERIAELAGYGYNDLIAWQNFGGLSHDDALASMRRFAEGVMPQLRQPTATAA